MAYSRTAKEIIRRRFSSSRYIFSKAGITRILAIILFLVAGILFLTENETRKGCEDEGGNIRSPPDWFPWLFPVVTVTSATISAVIYGVFVLGFAKKSLKFWVILDITLSMFLIVTNLVISILVITSCNAVNTVNGVPGPLGLVGTTLLILSAVATYFMWRFHKEEAESSRNSTQSGGGTHSVNRRTNETRDSIFA